MRWYVGQEYLLPPPYIVCLIWHSAVSVADTVLFNNTRLSR